MEWLDRLDRLFPEDVIHELTVEAVDRFGLTEVLTNPEALERVEPDLDTMKLLLSMRQTLPTEVLEPVRRLIRTVVEELTERLRSEVLAAVTGRVNRRSRTRRPTGVVDADPHDRDEPRDLGSRTEATADRGRWCSSTGLGSAIRGTSSCASTSRVRWSAP